MKRWNLLRSGSALLIVFISGFLAWGCGHSERPYDENATWSLVVKSERAALMSVHGTSADDVWAVGADDGNGALVLHWNGEKWQRHLTGVVGDLWWVQALDDGSVLMSGSDAQVLKYADGEFERLPTPGLGKHIVFGLWAADAKDVYAVGSAGGRNGFIWHYDGKTWANLELPTDLPLNADNDVPAFFKVWGSSKTDVWVVGGEGALLRGNAEHGFEAVATNTDVPLFTVHGSGDRAVVVGGDSSGRVLDVAVGAERATSSNIRNPPLLQGVFASKNGLTWAVGANGVVYQRVKSEWKREDTGLSLNVQSLHAVYTDPKGGVWAVGGSVLTNDLDKGVLIHRGPEIEEFEVQPPDVSSVTCDPEAVDPHPDASIARRWNDQLLNAIRRDTPRPTVHARNLYHTSLAVWDAWAAYDESALGYVSEDKVVLRLPNEVGPARDEAISYAAFRVLSKRYANAVGAAATLECLTRFMLELGYDPDNADAKGDAPHQLGNRVGQAVLRVFEKDGSNETNNYADADNYEPGNPLLVVDNPGTKLTAPLVWQKLALGEAVTQNGIELDSGIQPYIGAHWRDVTPFAVVRPMPGQPYFPGLDPPSAFDDALIDAVVEIIRKSAELDITDEERWDISPGGYGNNSLGADDGTGHPENPVTEKAYEAQRVLRGDFTRVLAEFWADGPASETPPGHWNTLANYVSYHPEFERKLFGQGEELDPLAWDVHVYLALNGAVHDAAIVAWELKREYLSARPISLVRYLASLGQRSDPKLPSYDTGGLPLVDGLVELITKETVKPGARHAHLARYVGELALFSWRGEPGDRDAKVGGVGWVRALDWVPYQRRNFVTPAFPGYTSGHSTFSRAAARVLAELTGSAYFPGGLGEFVAKPGYLFFEHGPSETVRLQWATYFDASDQAGQSRLWGGIHIRHDDYDGRKNGDAIGQLAVERARHYYGEAAGK